MDVPYEKLAEVVSWYVKLEQDGSRLRGKCLLCGDGNAFFVSPETHVWKCFACGAGGNVRTFLELMEERGIKPTPSDKAAPEGACERVELSMVQTTYNGKAFQSGLHARWAVFFDHLGIAWKYRETTYDLKSTGVFTPEFWLPDVWYRHVAKGTIVQIVAPCIRGMMEPLEVASALCVVSGHACHVVVGTPAGSGMEGLQWFVLAPNPDESGRIVWDAPFVWYRCQACNAHMLCFPETSYENCPECGSVMDWGSRVSGEADVFAQAAHKANTARLELWDDGCELRP